MTEDKTQQSGQTSSDGDTPLHPRASEFDIPKFVQKKYAGLINLIMETKSMDDKERQYWFHILPIMSEKQVEKLRAILNKEKSKLSTIDSNYNNKMKALQEEKVNRWEQGEIKEKFADIKKKEQTYEEQEKAAEEELLKKLEDI